MDLHPLFTEIANTFNVSWQLIEGNYLETWNIRWFPEQKDLKVAQKLITLVLAKSDLLVTEVDWVYRGKILAIRAISFMRVPHG